MRHAEKPIAICKWMGWVAVILMAGCAPTKVETMQEYSGKDPLPRPTLVLVHDFAVSPDDVSLNSGPLARLARVFKDAPASEEQIKVGRAVAQALSDGLVEEMQELGFNAERSAVASPPDYRVLRIEGAFLSIDEGNRARRLVVGFGAGGTSVKTRVHVSFGTLSGPLKVAEFETVAESSKRPGIGPMAGVGAAATSAASAAAVSGVTGAASELNQEVAGGARRTAKEIAKTLSQFFAGQEWISKEMIIE